VDRLDIGALVVGPFLAPTGAVGKTLV